MRDNQYIDYNRLKLNYPAVRFIGLVGFDTARQKLVLLNPDKDENASEIVPGRSIRVLDGQLAVELNSSGRNLDPGPRLSQREQEILQLVVMADTNAQIARKLTISENTVKRHLQNIFTKLKVQSRTEAAMYAMERGWATRQSTP